MNNVIPLKRSEHVISDAELDKLANDISSFTKRYPDSMCLSHGIRKLLSDALKRDRHGPDLISTPESVRDRLWHEKFGPKPEREDGDTERGPQAS